MARSIRFARLTGWIEAPSRPAGASRKRSRNASMRERIPIAADPSTQGTNGRFGMPQWADGVPVDLVGILRGPLSGGDGAPLTQTLTESFCERCGTRYEFTAPTRL